jgi:hypothetical protein
LVTVIAVTARQVMTRRYRRAVARSTHLDASERATVASYPARRAYLRAASTRDERSRRTNTIRALARWSTLPASSRERPEVFPLLDPQ